ncbi:MAG: hypothetical protein ACTSXD_02110 [Candidatus Heimdallarchaeaceae archaeon]
MKKVQELLLLLEKYKFVDFKKIDRKYFEKIRHEEIQNFDRINDEAILKTIAYIAKISNMSMNDIRKLFKVAIDKKSYADMILHIDNLVRQNKLNKSINDFTKSIAREVGKKMDKLNLDLIADDKTLEKEGFFKEYPHLKK